MWLLAFLVMVEFQPYKIITNILPKKQVFKIWSMHKEIASNKHILIFYNLRSLQVLLKAAGYVCYKKRN